MDIDRYLARLNLFERPKPDWQGLALLQKAHLLHVPFENLAIHYGEPIDFSPEKLFDKVVRQGRGGFCYELNTLYNDLLTKLGFQTQLLSGRVYSQEKAAYGYEFDHLTILVALNGSRYLTDVGFGEFPLDPIPFDTSQRHDLKRGSYQIDHYDNTYYRLNRVRDGQVDPQFLFQDQPRVLSEFKPMCHYHQTSPDSYFTQQKFISIPTENGRITLSGNKWKIHHPDGSVTEEPLKETFEAAVKKRFGTELPGQSL